MLVLHKLKEGSQFKSTHMKQELLEHIIRHCIREVISQIGEADDDIKGAPAPPADGQGTADQPAIPQKDPNVTTDLKGIVFVNPKDKAKLSKIVIPSKDDAGMERSLYQQIARLAGSKIKIALSTYRLVKDTLKNPSGSLYLYLGKQDPDSDEIYLMADKSLQIAKDASISPEELSGQNATSNVAPSSFHPTTADAGEYAQRIASQGRVQPTGIDENIKLAIKHIVNNILNNK